MIPTTTTLLVWANKTLESAASEIGTPFDTWGIRYEFALVTKVLATNDPSKYVQAKDKHEWEKAMSAEYDSLMKNKTELLFHFLLEII